MKRSMRWVVSGVAVLGLAQSAVAADLDFLRGSEVFAPGPAVYSNWSGFYFGAQAGYANANMDFTSATSLLIAQMLRNTALLNGSALTSNFFLRGEFEWLQFARVEGITANITTGRVGAGVKF